MASGSPGFDTIFCAAIEIASAEDRAAYIARACGNDPDLRQRVERLVDAHFRAGSFLEEPQPSPTPTVEEPKPAAPPLADAAANSERAGTQVGPYKLVEQIGEGGMGTVW